MSRLRSLAGDRGYAVRFIENDFDPVEQAAQVERTIDAGSLPDLWLIWPVASDDRAVRWLAETGRPVVQLNQPPVDPNPAHLTAYVGPDDVERGRSAARLIIEARDQVATTSQGDGDGGRLAILGYPADYRGHGLVMEGLSDGLAGSGVRVVHESLAGFGAEGGRQSAEELLASGRQFDIVFAMDDAILTGAMDVLLAAGLDIGVDVLAVGSIANGDRSLLDSGRQYATTVQAPAFEAQVALDVVDEYLEHGHVGNARRIVSNPPLRAVDLAGATVAGPDGRDHAVDDVAIWSGRPVTAGGEEEVMLRLQGVRRYFGPIRAVEEANFELRPGEVMGLVGENGAGKSTLVKIISGFDSGFTGSIELDGSLVELGTPARAKELGIAIAQQELSLIPTLTIAENIFLGDPREPRWGTLKDAAIRAQPFLQQVGLGDLDPMTRVDRLSVGEQHLVEVARLAARNTRILILDEPTAALGEAESQRILDMVRRMADAGHAVIYVSHRLDEIFDVADRVTVMRDGHSQEAVSTSQLDVDGLIERMLGRPLANMFPPPAESPGRAVVEVRDLWADGLVNPVSLDIRKGEILGLAGQLGSGAGYLLASIAGAREHRGGHVIVDGHDVVPGSVHEMLRLGIGYCSSDRKHDGLFLGRPIRENLTAPAIDRFASLGWLRRARERSLSEEIAQMMTVDQARLDDLAGALSGGNQQKVAVGKWLSIDPLVLLIDEPTRGVDVGARAEIYLHLRELADEGLAVVFASTDLTEVRYLPDRIATFYHGRLIDVYDSADAHVSRILQDITQGDASSLEVTP